MVRLRVSRGLGIKLAESLQVIHRQFIAQEVQKHILKCASKNGDQHFGVRQRDGDNIYACLSGQVGQKKIERYGRIVHPPIGQDESITIEPLGVLRVCVHEAREDNEDLLLKKRVTLLTGRKGRARLGPCPAVHLTKPLSSGNARKTRRYARDEPGWPELAFPTTSTARVRIVAMATLSDGFAMKDDMLVVKKG